MSDEHRAPRRAFDRRLAGGAAVAALVVALVGAAPAASEPRAERPPAAKAVELVLQHVRANRDALGVEARDLADLAVSATVVDDDTGATHVYLQQRHGGIDVAGAVLNATVTSEGRILTVGNRLVGGLATAVSGSAPGRSAAQGVAAAAKAVGLELRGEPRQARPARGAAQETVFEPSGLSERPIPAKLVYARAPDGALRLGWNVAIKETEQAHWWDVTTDAATGDLLAQHDLFDEEGSYNVFAHPLEAPSFGARSVVVNPADAVASPFGWHDTNGAAGAESTLTKGNNVHAGTILTCCRFGVPNAGTEADGGAALSFDFLLDLTQEPTQYRPAAVTNLFYWNNVIHDVLYRHGFDEDAGNFQVNNYGRGGLGGDAVNAAAQHWFATNNAMFGTPPDGSAPEMLMGVWAAPDEVSISVTSPVAAEYAAWPHSPLRRPSATGVTGTIELVNDGVGQTDDACEPLVGFTPGNIAFIHSRQDIGFGSCHLSFVVQRAEAADASAVVLLDAPANHGLFAGTIPVVALSLADGAALKASLPVTATIRSSKELDRDSSFDNGIVAHEYGHGVSNRLVGGPANVSCLWNAEQMGEGWSDYLALVLTARGGTAADAVRGVGTYAIRQQPDHAGIRGAPYSRDMSVNPWTYDDLKTVSGEHAIGMRWAAMLWEVYWNLVDEHGYESDHAASWTAGGNTLALRLVLDGMKLTPCSPGFVDARDAVLLADENLTGGENRCAIWAGFAKRGLGASAAQGSPQSKNDGAQAFDLPLSCGPFSFTGFFGSVKSPPAVNAAKAGSTVPLVFGLGGNYGLDVLRPGSPSVRAIDCATLAPSGAFAAAAGGPLLYDAVQNRYTFSWKSDKQWTGCRELQLRLADGTTRTAAFRFTK